MDSADIELWKDSFVEAADRAVAAGFDLVELHAAHGYGLNQWLSPLTNQRADDHGQSLWGRTKLLRDIIEALRKNHPQLLISVRMPGQDFLPGGLTLDKTLQIAKILQNADIQILSVSSGIGGWRRPSSRVGQGYLVDEASQIQSHLAIPVIGVGGIETGDYIDHGVSTGQFSLAAVGRAILSDPEAWGTRNLGLNRQAASHHIISI